MYIYDVLNSQIMTNKVQLLGGNSKVVHVTPQEETQCPKRSEMCIGWSSTTQLNNVTTGLIIRITQSMINDNTQVVPNTASVLLSHQHCTVFQQTEHNHRQSTNE